MAEYSGQKKYTAEEMEQLETDLHRMAAEIAQKTNRVHELESQNIHLRGREAMLEEILRSRSWRLAQWAGRLWGRGPLSAAQHETPVPPDPEDFSLSRDKKTVLLIDESIPAHNRDAGSRTLHDYVRLLLEKGFGVAILPADGAYTPYAEEYAALGVPVLYGAWFSANWQAWAQRNSRNFAAIWLNRPDVSERYIGFFKAQGTAPVLYYGMDLHFLRQEREFEVTRSPLALAEADRLRALELSLVETADCALFPSTAETDLLRRLLPAARVLTLPPYITENRPAPPYTAGQREGLLFVGNYNHRPNANAVEWLVEEIMPRVHKTLPHLPLVVAGNNPPAAWGALEEGRPWLRMEGHLPSKALTALYQNARLCVAPLRFGAGIKGKIVQAMELGLPVLTTSVGAEGLTDGKDILAIADTAKGFARDICRLYEDEAALRRLAEKAALYAKSRFSPHAAWAVLRKAMQLTP